jgi:cobalt-zinc-cadmium efflux system membrane fusion protein
MVQFSSRWIRDGLISLGVVVTALAAVLVVRVAVQANRARTSEDEHPAEQAQAGADPVTSVRLDRPELAAAAGIEVEPVQSRSLESTISCNANAGFNQNRYVKVPPKADGILSKINVDVGANVRAGDVLAVVNSQALGDLKASYIKALVHQEHLRWQIEKFTAAAEGIAAKNLFEARHFLEEELADTARIRSRLDNFGLSPGEIDAISKNKDLGIQLQVIAPRDGTIVERQAVEGEPVETTRPLFAIADLATMWIHLFVNESQLRYVHLGQSVTFHPDGLPGRGFTGTVTSISPQVDSQTRTIQLRAEVLNPEGTLRANMFGKGELLIERPQQRLVVPQTSVQLHNGNHVVFVQKPNNVFEVRRIAVGLKDDKFWEVTTGLEPGERVATRGSFLLKSNLEDPDFGKVE